MSVPTSCSVLVIGGGPSGSFASAALAREGYDVVQMELEKMPRYHIGESMLPSMRSFLKFIDADAKMDAHGFNHKNGAAFKLNHSQPEAYTDFIAAGGPNGYAWNVIRSEADHLLFKHAESCGAKTFEGIKVESVQFEESEAKTVESSSSEETVQIPGRPVSATWTRKEDGATGTISFKYIVDASGRQGLLSTKYLKHRKYNQGLKNIANWGYYKGHGKYGLGTHKEGSPFFEALTDGSGWCWFIPLHNGTVSIGIVENQQMATDKKKEMGSPSLAEFFQSQLKLVPGINALLGEAQLISDIKAASDWSYSAPLYAFPYARICGDAGCFIDPFFSSGVHMAALGGICAAVTICAAEKGHCDEQAAATWHSKKITESYTRFLLVVSSALKQIRMQTAPVIADFDENGFQRAFDIFRPVIQGTADANNANKKVTQSDLNQAVEFCLKAFINVTPEQKDALVAKLKKLGLESEINGGTNSQANIDEMEKSLTAEEKQILDSLRSRRMIREDGFTTESFELDAIDGMVPNLKQGMLGLKKADGKGRLDKSNMFNASYLDGKGAGIRKVEAEDAAPANGTNGTAANGNNGVLSSLTQKGSMLDDASRHTLMASLHEAAENLETPIDLVMRISNMARQLPFIRIGMDLGIFKALVSSQTPLSAEQLSAPKGADPALVTRILRYLASNRLVAEKGPNAYTSSKLTEALADPRTEGAMTFLLNAVSPVVQELPAFFKQNGYQSPREGSPLAFQKSFGTDKDFFSWLKTQPETIKGFQGLMSIPRNGDWLSVMPIDSTPTADGAPILVDVGGSIGHQSQRLIAAHPKCAGKVVCQDLPETIERAPKVEGIEFMAHDFFKPQPVKGARYYYIRTCLHNWDDDKCVDILANIQPSMGAGSQILIDEIALPNVGAHYWSTTLDMQMLTTLGAMERTEDHWRALLQRAGLKVVDIKIYEPVMRNSIIVAEKTM